MAGKTPMASHDRSDDRTPVNRRLIRPNLGEMKEKTPGRGGWRKQTPPEQTNAESFYYLKQMNAKTPMVLVMTDGEVLRGVIEWYDRACVKVNREDGPNLLVMKHSLKYVYKQEDDE
jgi:sRNA-binding regulator protein Hfq